MKIQMKIDIQNYRMVEEIFKSTDKQVQKREQVKTRMVSIKLKKMQNSYLRKLRNKNLSYEK